ncbi:hypothetical protein ScPMuIL_003578 [Solemya velum]
MAIVNRLKIYLMTIIFGFCLPDYVTGNCPRHFEHGDIVWNCDPVIGKRCSYKCHTYYEKTSYVLLTCGENNEWSHNTSELCSPIVCAPLTIPNGQLDPDCDGVAGVPCSFTCDRGFEAPMESIALMCKGRDTENNGWNHDPHYLCYARNHQCSYVMENGHLDYNCTRVRGESCKVICDEGYRGEEKAFCNMALEWSPPVHQMCQAISCPINFRTAQMNFWCGAVGTYCSFECNTGYYTTNSPQLKCGEDGQWSQNPDDICRPLSVTTTFSPWLNCDTDIPNGQIYCPEHFGADCSYLCNADYEKRHDVIHCQSDGSWNIPPSLLCASIDTDDYRVDYSVSINVAIGIGGMVLILLICFAIFACFLRRRSELMRARGLRSSSSSTMPSNMASNNFSPPMDPPPMYDNLTHGHIPQVAPPPYVQVQTDGYPHGNDLECAPPAYDDVIKDWNTLEIAENYRESPNLTPPSGCDNPSFAQEDYERLQTVAEPDIHTYTALESENTNDSQTDGAHGQLAGVLSYI